MSINVAVAVPDKIILLVPVYCGLIDILPSTPLPVKPPVPCTPVILVSHLLSPLKYLPLSIFPDIAVALKFILPISTAPETPDNVFPPINWGGLPAPGNVKSEVKLVTPAFVAGTLVHSPEPAVPVKTHQSPTFQSPGVAIGFVDLKLFG